jgi:phosphoglucosamine mutase
MRKFFGTDGIRGQANAYPMTAEMALKVGMAAGLVFKNGGHSHRVVIGKDTRLSGYMLENALVAGFTSVGMDVFLLGPLADPFGRDADPVLAYGSWCDDLRLSQSLPGQWHQVLRA